MNLLIFAYLWILGVCVSKITQFHTNHLQLQVYSYFDHQPRSNIECIQSSDLLIAFWTHYRRFEHAINDALLNPTDSTVLARLGDDLDEFLNLVAEVLLNHSILLTEDLPQNANIFEAQELLTLHINLSMMQTNIYLQYEQMLDQSHHGHPTVVQITHTGHCGRPRIHIDPDFLRWAYAHCSTFGIARFLHVG